MREKFTSGSVLVHLSAITLPWTLLPTLYNIIEHVQHWFHNRNLLIVYTNIFQKSGNKAVSIALYCVVVNPLTPLTKDYNFLSSQGNNLLMSDFFIVFIDILQIACVYGASLW